MLNNEKFPRLLCWSMLFLFLIGAATSSSLPPLSNASSWSTLQISPKQLCSMPYGNFRVSVYEHADNFKSNTAINRHKYFYAPIALLDQKSATSEFNNVTKQTEMRFRIEMWNSQVEYKVVKYLCEFLGHQVKSSYVQVIPMEKMVLVSTIPSTVYSLPSNWLPYRLQESLWFALTCLNPTDCDKLAMSMQSKPHQFEHLKLLFSLESQTSQTRETAIRIDNIVSGQMISKLMQRYDSVDPDPLLTANDEKRLLTETMTNIIVETFDDSDVIPPTSELQIYNMLKELLISSRVTIKEEKDEMWKSVFWNEDNYRPDKTTNTLNSIYEKLDKESQEQLVDFYRKNKQFGASGEISFYWFLSKFGTNEKLSQIASTSKFDLDNLYQESQTNVEWNGEKFVPKLLSLARINLSKLRDRQSLQDRTVRVRYSTAVLSTPINFAKDVHTSPVISDDYWRTELVTAVNVLKENLSELSMETKVTVDNLKKELLNAVGAVPPIEVITQNKMPTSCRDLRLTGHIASGFYSIVGSKLQLETVYCNFTRQPNEKKFQTMIGCEDIKSMPTYFYVQKKKHFRLTNTPIPFELERLNEGGAMNLQSGIFTAPRTGRYFFSLSGVAKFEAAASNDDYIGVVLKLNGNSIGRGHTEGNVGDGSGFQTLSLQSMLNLKALDEIWLEIDYTSSNAFLHEDAHRDDNLHYTHFSGWLMQEDISLILLDGEDRFTETVTTFK